MPLHDTSQGENAPWTTYTPAWTASGSNPAIGNGTLAGAYIHKGMMLLLRVYIVMGSTTTYGTGQFRIGLPSGITAKTGARQTGLVLGLDSGTQWRIGIVVLETDGTYFTINTGGTGTSDWQAATPQTWAVNDAIQADLLFEVNEAG